MDPIVVGILGSGLLFLFLLMGVPIAFSLMLVGFLGTTTLTSVNAALPMVARTVYESSSQYPYTIIPLFIVMGSYAEITGISRDLYDTFDKWLRRLPGGLGMATIASIAGFSAISGSSVASSAAFGKVAYPEMRRFNYSPRLAAGTVAAGATIDFLIPPSLGFVIFGMLTEQSIGKLLISGMIPGLMLAGAFMAILYVWVRFNPNSALSSPEEVSWKEKISALKGIWETIVIFLLVIGGIYTGLFTPTEAAGVGATLIFLMAVGKRKLTWKILLASLLEATRVSVMVLFLVAGANVFSYFLALSTIPMQVSSWIVGLGASKYLILTIIVFIYLILGCFLDAISMMILTLPVIFPVILNLGFDPLWFGVVCVLMMGAGLITPPMGLCVFTVAGIAKDAPLEEVFKGALPFLIAILLITFLITLFPQIALFLPSLMGR
ncbi:MAG: C4-dicarboxylate ABC transporter permease [Deltaproteobacteria bacterium RBG_16_47_11]|nr:MAG: C4-dicarboxylate ABC transporter permease [Deltaproteobacteria bacterium RBG_16_47_11]